MRTSTAMPGGCGVASQAEQLAAARAAAARSDFESALAIWSDLGHAGISEAQWNVGQCFVNGWGVEKNPKLAKQWLTLAAESGDPIGQRMLAEFYFKGDEGKPDPEGAFAWYRRAAVAGDAAAQDMLSWMLADEESGTPDYSESREWAMKAAAQGNAPSMTRLGLLYHNALGVPRDPVMAAMWWEKAAYRGDGDAQAMLGAAYHLGSGRKRDPLAALTWLKRAKQNYSKLADRYYESVWANCSPEQRRLAATQADAPLVAGDGP